MTTQKWGSEEAFVPQEKPPKVTLPTHACLPLAPLSRLRGAGHSCPVLRPTLPGLPPTPCQNLPL